MGVMDYVNNTVVFLSELKPLFTKSIAISFPSFHWFRTPIRKIRYKLRNCPVYFYDKEKITSLLTKENIAYDINGYPKAPPSFRIWGGGTVEPDNIKNLLPWIDWAYHQVKGNFA